MPDKKNKKTDEDLDKINFRNNVTKRLQGLEDAAAVERKVKKKAEREANKKKRKARRAERLAIKGLGNLQGLQGLT
jgi:hypothetical protein